MIVSNWTHYPNNTQAIKDVFTGYDFEVLNSAHEKLYVLFAAMNLWSALKLMTHQQNV